MEGVADIATLSLDEGITHSSADDKVVHLAEKVLKDSEFGRDLGSSDDSRERMAGILEDVVDSLNLFLHQVTEHLVVREI